MPGPAGRRRADAALLPDRAAVDGSVCVFLEPIALYHTRDLHSPGDNEWLAPYAAPADWAAGHVPIGRARTLPGGLGRTT